MLKLLAALVLTLSMPALAAHERMFEFPSSAVGFPLTILVNVLQVVTILKIPQGDGTVVVQLTMVGAQPQANQFGLTQTFANDTDAQAFVALWRARIEDAR